MWSNNMKYKKKTYKKRLSRKRGNTMSILKEWSRMLHKWWKVDLYNKSKFKKNIKDYYND